MATKGKPKTSNFPAKRAASSSALSDGPDFSAATRKLLFREAAKDESAQKIPGAGKSAAETPRRHVRVKVTMNVDGDILAHFKEQASAEGLPYQTLMNQVLREYIQGSRPERLAAGISELLLEDATFLTAVAKKVLGDENGD